ncbi:MAG: NADH-quinone oxidoreductase subunit N [Candidatus Aenigmarchaeota archaeon]|nr:NADH-quinone oxidoreductase subunit N [Candidatus Aenigmarchaeota archaeon]
MIAVLPYLAVFATIVMTALMALSGKDVRKVSMIGLLVSLFLSVFASGIGGRFFGVLFISDFSVFFNIIFLLSAYVIVLFSSSYIKHSSYYLLISLSTLGMMLVSGTTNLVAMYAALEMVALSSYALIVSGRKPENSEAGIKYFIITIFSSAIILLGLALLYAAGGSVDVATMTLTNVPLALFSIILLTAGFGFKTGAAPFNFWVPDVYQGAPSQIAGLLAGAAKKAGFAALFLVFFIPFLVFSRYWMLPWAVLALVTMTFGNIVALSQTNVKRMFAYSIIGQSGYIMIALATVNKFGLIGGLFHSFTHAFMVIGAFFIAAVLGMKGLETIDDYKGLGKRSPFLAFSLLIFLASLAGIPPLAGFVSKFILFSAAIDAGLGWLAVAAVLNSGISVYYYFRLVRSMYSDDTGEKIELPAGAKTAIIVCVLLLAAFGLYPNPILSLAQSAVRFLGFF